MKLNRLQVLSHRASVLKPCWVVSLVPLVLLLLVALTPRSVAAQPFAYIPNALGASLTVLDTATNTSVAEIPMEELVFGVAVSPDGRTVYVTSFSESTLWVIDADTNTVRTVIPTGGLKPRGVSLSPDGSLVLVANGGSGDVSVFDASTLQLRAVIPTGAGATQVVPHPNGRIAYVTNQDEDTISRIDVRSGLTLDTRPAGDQPSGLALQPDLSTLWVADERNRRILLLDPETLEIQDTIELPDRPELVIFHPSGRAAYVTSPAASMMWVIDVATRQITAAVPQHEGAEAIEVHPDGDRLYVINLQDSTVSVIGLDSMSIQQTIPVGLFPIGVGHFIGPPAVGGAIRGAAGHVVRCRNLATGQEVAIPLTGDPSWDCERSGLSVQPGDPVRMTVQAKAR